MKKLVTAASLLLAAGIAMADVTSGNTVGYVEHAIDPNYGTANLGVCFVPVDNPSGNFTVSSNFLGTALNDYDVFYAFSADDWELSGYTYQGAANGWYYQLADGTDGSAATITIAPGTSFFYMGANESFRLCGQIATSGTQTRTFNPDEAFGFDFVNPFPVATTFADLETFVQNYDVFYVFDPDEWELSGYTYQGAANGWYYQLADGTVGSIPSGSSQVFLEAGRSATYCPGSAVTWTTTLNY